MGRMSAHCTIYPLQSSTKTRLHIVSPTRVTPMLLQARDTETLSGSVQTLSIVSADFSPILLHVSFHSLFILFFFSSSYDDPENPQLGRDSGDPGFPLCPFPRSQLFYRGESLGLEHGIQNRPDSDWSLAALSAVSFPLILLRAPCPSIT